MLTYLFQQDVLIYSSPLLSLKRLAITTKLVDVNKKNLTLLQHHGDKNHTTISTIEEIYWDLFINFKQHYASIVDINILLNQWPTRKSLSGSKLKWSRLAFLTWRCLHFKAGICHNVTDWFIYTVQGKSVNFIIKFLLILFPSMRESKSNKEFKKFNLYLTCK